MFNKSKFIILVQYVNDILLAYNYNSLLYKPSHFYWSFLIKDHSDVFLILDIQIYCDRSRYTLGLSQKTYVEKVFSRYDMHNYASGDTLMSKGDRFNLQ